MLSVIFSMVLFSFVGAVTPGPVNMIATSSGASFGALRCIPFVFGSACGYTLVVLLVGLGLYPLLLLFPEISSALQWLGSGFLLYLAYRIATMGEAKEEGAVAQCPPGGWQGALVQILNPKAWLVAASGVALFVAVQPEAMLYLGVFVLISWLMCLAGVAVWAMLGHCLRRFLRQQHARHMNRLMGLLLAVSVINLLLSPVP